VGSNTDQLITSINHDEQGRETERQHGNGLESQKDYDPQGRLQKLRLGKIGSPVSDPTQDSSPILERGYQYNKAGQIAQIEDSLRGTSSYHYDALDRLTQVDGPNPEHFVHDPAHNILAAANSKDEAKQQASATEIKGNRLAFRGDTHYRYDIHGNRIAELRGKGQKLQTRYQYNSRQQLVRVEKLKLEEGAEQLQQEIHYQYDPLGRRIGKSTNNEQTSFLWDGDVLLRENKSDIHTQQDQSTRTYYFEPGTFKPVALKEDEQVYHYHLDHLGTPDTLTNQEGEVVWSVAYKSYGNIALAHENQIKQPIRFQGQYFDEETGLHYNRFRYYDPEVGEFTQQDPIGLLGGVNNYRYAPNPITWTDPFGLKCKEANNTVLAQDESDDLGLNPLGEVIPSNFNILENRYNKAQLVLETKDSVIARSASILEGKKGIPIITPENLEALRNVKVLVINGHGSGDTIVDGLSGDQMADFLLANNIKPDAIDVLSCCSAPGPARQKLADRMGVPVRGTMGRTGVDEDGDQWVWNEKETEATGQDVFYPKGEGYEVFTPGGGKK